jgi:hypothetical protein
MYVGVWICLGFMGLALLCTCCAGAIWVREKLSAKSLSEHPASQDNDASEGAQIADAHNHLQLNKNGPSDLVVQMGKT